jgi:hypothetical protein
MNSESLQKAYSEDAIGHPLLAEPDLMIPPAVGLVRQLSGVNGGIQNNLVFGDNGIAKGFLSQAPNVLKIFQDWIKNVSSIHMSDDEINNGVEIIRLFLMNNRFNTYDMVDEDMSKTATRHVIWHVSMSLDGNHDRLRNLLKVYSPTQFGYEYGWE